MDRTRETSRPYAIVCWVLAAAFAARVVGQALQRTLPQPFLPPAESFQGSALPYGLLLGAQLFILALMLRTTLRLHHGALIAGRRTGLVLAAFGGVYMVVALGRLGIGLALPDAHAWFRAWIPAVLHVVLAGFVLTSAAFHVVESRKGSLS
jgi:hypothetical protein